MSLFRNLASTVFPLPRVCAVLAMIVFLYVRL